MSQKMYVCLVFFTIAMATSVFVGCIITSSESIQPFRYFNVFVLLLFAAGTVINLIILKQEIYKEESERKGFFFSTKGIILDEIINFLSRPPHGVVERELGARLIRTLANAMLATANDYSLEDRIATLISPYRCHLSCDQWEGIAGQIDIAELTKEQALKVLMCARESEFANKLLSLVLMNERTEKDWELNRDDLEKLSNLLGGVPEPYLTALKLRLELGRRPPAQKPKAASDGSGQVVPSALGPTALS